MGFLQKSTDEVLCPYKLLCKTVDFGCSTTFCAIFYIINFTGKHRNLLHIVYFYANGVKAF